MICMVKICRPPKDGVKGGNCKTAYKGRLWCYIEEVDGNVYCKDATKSRKWVVYSITITAHFALAATAALTGRMTHASHQPELTNCASLLSPREGQSVTLCLELAGERWLEYLWCLHDLLFLLFLLIKSIPPAFIWPTSNHNVVFFKSERKHLCPHTIWQVCCCLGKTMSYHSSHPSRKESGTNVSIS